jgi:hypothetical protein
MVGTQQLLRPEGTSVKKLYWRGLELVLAAVLVLGGSIDISATNTDDDNGRLTASLESKDAHMFGVACAALVTTRDSGIQRLLKVAGEAAASREELLRQRDAIVTLGKIQALEALSFLVGEIELQNQPLVRPPGIRDPVLLQYPCAQALLDFRQNASHAILNELAEADPDRVTEREIMLYAYILQLVEGASKDRFISLQARITRDLGARADDDIRQRMSTAIVIPTENLREQILNLSGK